MQHMISHVSMIEFLATEQILVTEIPNRLQIAYHEVGMGSNSVPKRITHFEVVRQALKISLRAVTHGKPRVKPTMRSLMQLSKKTYKTVRMLVRK